MGARFRHLALGAAALFPWTIAASAWGATTYTLSISPSLPNLGKIAMPASASTFTVAPAGTVTQTGTGAFVNGSVTTRGLVSFTCAGTCNARERVVIAPVGTPTAPMSTLTSFSMATNSGVTLVGSAPTPASSITFTLSAVGSGTASFYVGMNVPLASSGASTGNGSAGWQVTVSNTTGGSATTSTSGLALATTFRPISVSKSTDLLFGTIVKPPSVSGSVALNAAGTLTVPTGAVALKTHGASTFFVYGEGSQTFSVSVTPTFAMTSGVNTLLVTTTPSTGTFGLGGAIGSQGSYSLGVGGSFPLGPTTKTGAYSGSFTVLAAYN